MSSIIVAITNDNAIGLKGELLYRVGADMKHFKSITMGHPIVMGRKTFESFPNGPLPGRRNIVVSRNPGFKADGIELYDNLMAALRAAGDEAFVIGGAEIYRQAIDWVDTLYLTRFDVSRPDADTFFPEINQEHWIIVDASPGFHDDKNGIDYKFVELKRKKNG